MRTWFLRVSAVVVTLGIVAAVAGYVAWSRFSQPPEWYRSTPLSGEAREAAARAAENRLITLQNRAGRARAAANRTQSTPDLRGAERDAGEPAGVDAAGVDAGPIEAQFTEAELNALLHKWVIDSSIGDTFVQSVRDPQIRLRRGGAVLAGDVEALGTVVSLRLGSRATVDGTAVRLTGVRGGRLPLPAATLQSVADRLRDVAGPQIDALRADADVSAEGHANAAAAGLAGVELLLGLLEGRDVVPTVYLPVTRPGGLDLLPARLTRLDFDDDTVTIELRLLDAESVHRLRQTLNTLAPATAGAPAAMTLPPGA